MPSPPSAIDPAQAQHPGRRESQQDACGFSRLDDEAFAAHGGHLAVLADGMGGGRNGLWAASHAVQAFIEAYQAKTADESIPAALQRALTVANGVVHDEAERLRAVDRMGTTLAVAVVRGLELHWLNVGDSRVYLAEDGHLMCLSTDHNFAEVLRLRVHRGELSAGEALGHPLRHALTSYLGRPDTALQGASTVAVQLRPGARVLLCSDGLTQALDDEQISQQLQGDAQSACDALLQAALARGLPDQDNTTAVVLHVPRPGLAFDSGTISRAVYAPPPRPAAAPPLATPAGSPAGVAAVPARPPKHRRDWLRWAGAGAGLGALVLLGLAWPTRPRAPEPAAAPRAPVRSGPSIDLLAPAASAPSAAPSAAPGKPA